MEIKLKSCPFCGEKAKIRRIKDSYKIMCAECGASSHLAHIQPWHDNKFVAQCQAAKAWNARFTATNEPLTLEELQEMVGQPVWVMPLEAWAEGEWALVAKVVSGYVHLVNRIADHDALALTTYGKCWIAYRRPQKGAVQ